MRILDCNAAVVGAGAAGLNAADELARLGVDVLLVADSLTGGTSRNAGSDKQTYYKLSMAGDANESVGALAQSFYAGGSMHGDHAHAMAALSARSFMKLTLLGVPFPHNEWGEYVGYQTDHDASQRATSAGPLTSREMCEALTRSIRARGVRTENGLKLLSVLTDEDGAAAGLLMYDGQEFVAVNARNVILCTGGAALAYEQTVFPEVQAGASGAVIRAGAVMNNLCYWQYGLASIKVRWNVSGSYQQALPCYTDGKDEFLAPSFASREDMLDSVFLKGYQWPFDAKKLGGSSRVDRAAAQLRARGGRVYMDFTREVKGGALNGLGAEARRYLENCGALQDMPIKRLNAINRKAVEFYFDRGIDLAKEPLEVAVCAQHSNGGIRIDEWWRTTIKGLYAAGECAGAFGIYRPGGSALNETQVGSLRAAQHIAAHGGGMPARSREDFLRAAGASIERETALFDRCGDGETVSRLLTQRRREMDVCAGAVRSVSGMKRLKAQIDADLKQGICGADPVQTAEAMDTLNVQSAMLSAMIAQSEFSGWAGHAFSDRKLSKDAPEAAGYAFETKNGETRAVPVRPLPKGGGWFETVWKKYQDGEVFGE